MSAVITKPFDVSWLLVCLLDHNVDGCCHVGTVDQGEETLRMEAQKDNRWDYLFFILLLLFHLLFDSTRFRFADFFCYIFCWSFYLMTDSFSFWFDLCYNDRTRARARNGHPFSPCASDVRAKITFTMATTSRSSTPAHAASLCRLSNPLRYSNAITIFSFVNIVDHCYWISLRRHSVDDAIDSSHRVFLSILRKRDLTALSAASQQPVDADSRYKEFVWPCGERKWVDGGGGGGGGVEEEVEDGLENRIICVWQPSASSLLWEVYFSRSSVGRLVSDRFIGKS